MRDTSSAQAAIPLQDQLLPEEVEALLSGRGARGQEEMQR